MRTGSVLIRFRHPTKNLTFFSSLLGLPANRNWVYGHSRQTPKGDALPGKYKDSYWSSGFKFSLEEGFKKQFELAIEHIEKAETEITEIVQSGGKAEIYLQLPGEENHGGVIDKNYISILNKFGIDLLIEVFP